MIKVFTLLLIPFLLIACDDDADGSASIVIKRFEKVEDKAFYRDPPTEFGFIRFSDVDVTNDRLIVTEFYLDENNKQRRINQSYTCDDTLCKTAIFNSQYDTITIDISLKIVQHRRLEVVEGKSTDQPVFMRRFLTEDTDTDKDNKE